MKIIFSTILILFSILAKAQTIVFTDDSLKQCVLNKYSYAFDENNDFNDLYIDKITVLPCDSRGIQSIDDLAQFTNLNTLFFNDNSIKNLDAIKDHRKLSHIRFDNNLITNLPETIDAWTNLAILELQHNQIEKIPSLDSLQKLEWLFLGSNQIKEIPSLSHQKTLLRFHIDHNNIETLPSLDSLKSLEVLILNKNPLQSIPSLDSLKNLKRFYTYNTSIKTIPDLSNHEQLTLLHAQNNSIKTPPNFHPKAKLASINLDSNYILPHLLESYLGFTPFDSIFTYKHQKTISFPTKLYQEDEFTELTIPFDFTSETENLSFTWFKNGVAFRTNKELYFEKLDTQDIGFYSLQITGKSNPLNEFIVHTDTIELRVNSCVIQPIVSSNIQNHTCSDLGSIVFNSEDSISIFSIYNKDNSSVLEENITGEFLKLHEGNYSLSVQTNSSCLFENILDFRIEKENTSCQKIITPNDDGIDDSYFIDKKGQIKILNKNGRIVKEFTGPNTWNGTDSDDQMLPTGLYFLVLDDEIIEISIMK